MQGMHADSLNCKLYTGNPGRAVHCSQDVRTESLVNCSDAHSGHGSKSNCISAASAGSSLRQATGKRLAHQQCHHGPYQDIHGRAVH